MLKDVFGERISKSITPEKTKAFENYVTTYIDQNSEILLTFDMSQRYSFSDKEREAVYALSSVSEAEMAAAIKKSKTIHSNNKIQSNPFYLLSMLVSRAYLAKKDEKHALQLLVYISLQMYTSSHKGAFKYNANKAAMDYTIAHLTQSFRMTNMTSLFAFIEDNATVAFNTYKSRILNGTDKDLVDVVDALWTRIKAKILRIANQYYKNYSSGKYLYADTESYSEEDYRELDNDSFMIDRLTNKVYLKLINHQYEDRLIKYAITRSDVSYQKVKNIIEDIIDSNDDKSCQKLISSIIEYFVYQSGKTPDYIAKGDFIAFMKSAYGSNTTMEQMATVKNIIEIWLDENASKYGRAVYNRSAKLEYRKVIYMFFVFLINNEAKIN